MEGAKANQGCLPEFFTTVGSRGLIPSEKQFRKSLTIVHPGDGGGSTGSNSQGRRAALSGVILACFKATHMLSAEQLPEVREKLRPGAARNPPWERAGGCNHGRSEK